MVYDKDTQLGQRIHALLLAKRVENPVFFNNVTNDLAKIEAPVTQLLQSFGMDLSNPSIEGSAKRIAKFFLNELFYGLNYDNFPKITTTPNEYAYHQAIFSQGIEFNSTCEHHLVTILGRAYIAYIPSDKVIGLSKINRIVDFFAKRPQVQERATRQIFFALQEVLATEDVAIAIQAKHHCIVIRGVRNENTDNTTIELGGKFATDAVLQNNMFSMFSLRYNN